MRMPAGATCALTLSVAMVGLCVAPTAPVRASGFYVPQQTAYGAGRANAGNAAMAAEASTVFFNPAGMTRLDGAEVLVAVNIVTPSDDFSNRGTSLSAPATLGSPAPVAGGSGQDPGAPTPVASLFYARPLGERWWVGVALTSPFGLRLEYDSDWFGRYDSIESELRTIDLAPSFAYQVSEQLAVGAGLNVQYADTFLRNSVPNTLSPVAGTVASDGRSELTGNNVAFGFNLGLLWQPTQDTRIGLHYRSRMDHELDGENKVRGLDGALAGANGKFDTKTLLTLPDVLSLGIAHALSPRTTLLGEAQWFGWSRFEELRIRYDDGTPTLVLPQDYRDTYTLSTGIEHRWRDAWTLRAGVQYDRTPTTDAQRNTAVPDANRLWTAIGASWRPTARAEISVAYQHVFYDQGRIDNSRSFFGGTPIEGEVVTRARVDAAVDTVSIAFRYSL
ncbi:MAG: outer membrane protein transport protein [Thiohalocapsa sp.]